MNKLCLDHYPSDRYPYFQLGEVGEFLYIYFGKPFMQLRVPKNFKIYLIIIRNSQTSSNLLILLSPVLIYREIEFVCVVHYFKAFLDNSKFEICQNDHPQDVTLLMSTAFVMGSSPGELSEELVTQEKRKKGWRMSL